MIRPQYASLSLRRAWIEIRIPANQPPQVAGRSPYGERGLKLLIASCAAAFPETSLSLRRAWIEIAPT